MMLPFFKQSARNGDPLRLALAETCSALEALRVKALRKVEHEVGSRGPECVAQHGVGCLGIGHQQVLAHYDF